MLACLIACQVPQPSVIRLNPSRRGQLRAIRVSSQRRTGLQLPGPRTDSSVRAPASTVTTWWPFWPEARTTYDLASGPRVGAYQICPAEHREPIAITTSRARARPKRPPPCDRVRLDPIPTQARTSAAGGCGTGQQVSTHGYNRAAVSLAPSESVPRGTLAVSAPRAVRWGPAASGPPDFQAEPSESQRARGDHPTPLRRGPSPRAHPSALHRATASARVPIPTQARASATGGCGTGQHVLMS